MPATGGAAGAPEAARERLNRYLAGHGVRRHLVYVAARLGLADLLAEGPRHSDDLASAAGAHPDTLYRVLRGMVAQGLLIQEGDGRFGLDADGVAPLLRSDAPVPLRGRVIRDAELTYAWGGLLHTVQTGESAFQHVFGERAFTRYARDPITAALGAGLNPGTRWDVAQAIAGAYDFGRFGTVVDVGGGDGTVLAAILQRYPHLEGVVLDQPHLMDDARRVAERYGVASRCRLAPGDFFAAVPAGDVLVLKTILHDWEDDLAIRLLERCRAALRPGGRVLVIDSVLPERTAQGSSHFDLVMLVEMGGRERTEREFRALFAAAGLALTGVRPLEAGSYTGRSLIEAATAPGVAGGPARTG